MGYKMKGFSGFKQSCGCDGKCMCSSPLKQNGGKCYIDKDRKKKCPSVLEQNPFKPKKSTENLDHIGTGFMNPPYKDTVKLQKSGVPYEKRQGYHGFKNFDSILNKNKNKN